MALDGILTISGGGGVDRDEEMRVHAFVHRVSEAPGRSHLDHRPLTITKSLDGASPSLLVVAERQIRIDEVALHLHFVDREGREALLSSIILFDARIVDIRYELLNTRYPENLPIAPREHVSFIYRDIEWHSPSGQVVGDRWWAGARR